MLLLAVLGNAGKYLWAQGDPVLVRVSPVGKTYCFVVEREGRWQRGHKGTPVTALVGCREAAAPRGSPTLPPAACGCSCGRGVFVNAERRLWSRKSQGKQQAKARQGKGGGKESNEW